MKVGDLVQDPVETTSEDKALIGIIIRQNAEWRNSGWTEVSWTGSGPPTLHREHNLRVVK